MIKIKSTLCAGSMILALQTFAQSPDPKYFNEIPPGTTPKVFAPGRVSTPSEFEFGSTFSKEWNEFYYGVEINGKAETRMMKFENGIWSQPIKVLVHEMYSFNDPFLSPDNQRLYFISDRPIAGVGPKKDYDVWYVERLGTKWSEPKTAGPNINSAANEYYISFTASGKMYFSSNNQDEQGKNNYDIYSSEMKGGEFQPALKLGPGVNTSEYEADVFVAPDEAYIIFAANRQGGLGVGDLYVSFHNADGTWASATTMGKTINTETDDFCPYVTPDGKYLFYASRGDIYWVSTEIFKKSR